MTIYVVRYLDTDVQQKKHFATSRFQDAQKKVRELASSGTAVVFDNNGEYVEKLPNTQDEIINIINSL
jgi:hypothetical protein